MSIVAKYNFARGNSQDLSGNAFHGTDTDVSYVNGGALFNGSTSMINLPTALTTPLPNYTIISNVKASVADAENRRAIINWDGSINNSNYRRLFQDTYNIRFRSAETSYIGGVLKSININTQVDFIANKLYQIASSIGSTNTLNVYQNGGFNNSGETSNRVTSFTANYVRVGAASWCTLGPSAFEVFNGTIYDVTVYNHELSPSEIKNNYAYNKGFYNG